MPKPTGHLTKIDVPLVPILSDDELVAMARRADADTVSVLRRLVGLPVRGRAGERVDAALRGER
jgi:hypothetical protein